MGKMGRKNRPGSWPEQKGPATGAWHQCHSLSAGAANRGGNERDGIRKQYKMGGCCAAGDLFAGICLAYLYVPEAERRTEDTIDSV